MKTFAQKIAWAYARGSAREQSLATMITISFVSITLSTCALALGIFLLHGFQNATYRTLKSIHPDLVIQEIPTDANNAFLAAIDTVPGVYAVAPTTTKYVILKTEDAVVESPLILKGIDPTREHLVSNLESMLITPNGVRSTLSELLTTNHVIIGKKLADVLGLKINDPLTILFADMGQVSSNKITLDQQKVIVSGMIATGVNEVDESLLLCNQTFIENIFGPTLYSSVGIAVEQHQDPHLVQQTIAEQLRLPVLFWTDLYPSLDRAMKLEKLGGYIALSLLFFLSSLSIMGLMFLMIMHKKRDIALLQAMGTQQPTIYAIFWYIGITLALLAHALGLLLAIVVGFLLKQCSFITLPDMYFCTQLPIEISMTPVMVIFLCGCIVSCIAVVIPLRSIKNITIPAVLKQEQ